MRKLQKDVLKFSNWKTYSGYVEEEGSNLRLVGIGGSTAFNGGPNALIDEASFEYYLESNLNSLIN